MRWILSVGGRGVFAVLTVTCLLGTAGARAELLTTLFVSESTSEGGLLSGAARFIVEYDGSSTIGETVDWEPGETGTASFSVLEPGFAEFALAATDGVDEPLSIGFVTDSDGYAQTQLESEWPLGTPDLGGYTLTGVELNVFNFNYFESDTGGVFEYELSWTFYGDPIPEPATIAGLLVGLAALRRR